MIISTPHFRIKADISRGMLTMALVGFWDDATFKEYNEALESAGRAFGRNGKWSPTVKVLVDLREHQVQSKEIAAEIQKLLDGIAPVNRCAVIMPLSAVKRSQVMRTAAAVRNQQLFSDEEDALLWLSS